LSRKTFVLRSDGPWILDLNLLSAFHWESFSPLPGIRRQWSAE
jgi:hypothetical protein